jgi:glutamate racemase
MAFEDPCNGLVKQIEAGYVDGPETERILNQALEPMLAAGVDTLVLGCTHYPFVRPLIQRLAGPYVEIVDPAPAVARQVRRVLQQKDLFTGQSDPGKIRAYTTGDTSRLAYNIRQLLGGSFVEEIELASAFWLEDGALSAQ